MSYKTTPLDLKTIATIRTLAVDTVDTANSGHPGAPLGLAPLSETLVSRFLRISPKHKEWSNRDRFVLSNGHAGALQYVTAHLLGYDISLDDLKHFRQVGSKTPGHPERSIAESVEVTTGPLGQGIAMGVGLAAAQAHLAATFNKDGFPIFDNKTYVFLGDGCMQEGVASEAASLAGHWKLNNLIAFYDRNGIQIDGTTDFAFTEDVEKRYAAYGWHVIHPTWSEDDLSGLYNAIVEAQKVTDKPTLITVDTVIGFGSKIAGEHAVHGAPLKPDDAQQLKAKFGFNPDEFFVAPQDVVDYYKEIGQKNDKIAEDWYALVDKYAEKYPKEGADLKRRIAGKLPEGWDKNLPTFTGADKPAATRKLSQGVISVLAENIPEFVSGSADLTPSNLTNWPGVEDFQASGWKDAPGSFAGRYFRYGVREHAMVAILNGLAAYGKNLIIPAGGTFLNFVSYASGSVRIGALSHLRTIIVATHDSIGLGEDGPTHQPIETAAHLRALPNMNFWRPADGNEVSAAYKWAVESDSTPSVIALTRQNVPQLEGSSIDKALKGAYTVYAAKEQPKLIYISTGSEVALAIDAAKLLEKEGIPTSVVSMPSEFVFDKQPQDYRLSVLPDGVPIVSLEVYSTFGWAKYAHESIGLNRYGTSGPSGDTYKYFGFVPDKIADQGKKVAQAYKPGVLSPINKVLL